MQGFTLLDACIARGGDARRSVSSLREFRRRCCQAGLEVCDRERRTILHDSESDVVFRENSS